MRQEISFKREERDPLKEERERESYLDALHMMNAAEKMKLEKPDNGKDIAMRMLKQLVDADSNEERHKIIAEANKRLEEINPKGKGSKNAE